MKIRRRFIVDTRRDKAFQKCLALALMLKDRLHSSRILAYSTNRLCGILNISHKAAKKYEGLMLEYELIHFEGTDHKKVLIINRLTSHTANRNIDASFLDTSSFQTAIKSVQAFMFMKIQHNKDYIRHLLQTRHDPKTPEEYRKARRKVKNLVTQGRLKSVDDKYKEYGLSLSKVAKELGCCIRTAQRITGFAYNKGWVDKVRRFTWVYAPHVNHREVPGYTFSTRHRLCIVKPNLYLLSDELNLVFNACWYGII